MHAPKALRDDTLDRVREATARLQECLLDAAHIRARLTEARAANAWPDLRSGSTLFPDSPAPLRSIRSAADDRTSQLLFAAFRDVLISRHGTCLPAADHGRRAI